MEGIPWRTQLWHRWKSLRNVPFRKKWFVGYDLEGNSYWEFRDRNNPSRLRRQIAHNRPHYMFGAFQPHPMWIQWLQFTRAKPPTLQDLVNDAQRLQRLKVLAEHADQKWRSKPLKSSSNSKNEDPRLDSAWSGQSVKPQFNEERTGWGEEPQEKDNVRLALEHAESQNKEQPRVYRDRLGQVTVERSKPK